MIINENYKNMKKVIIILTLSMLYACVSFAQVKFGLTAGLNGSNTTAAYVGGSNTTTSAQTTNDMKAGFQAGAVMDFGITDHLSLLPELLFSQRGSKGKNSSLTLNYLQLPLNIAYKFNVGNGKLFVFGGMYFSYALSGKGKSAVGNSFDIHFGSAENEYKPFDFGINAGAGYQYQKLFAKLQFNPGLGDLSNTDNISLKNTNIAISLGYFFNK
jgi:hypothetical protein